MFKHAYIIDEDGTSRSKEAHILVTGHSGSGKSTYAKQLAEQNSLELENLDKHEIMRDIFSQGNNMSGDGSWANKEGDLLKDFLAKRLSEGPERVIEGSQLLHLDSIPKGSKGILVDIPEDRILEQGLRRKLQRMAERGEFIDSSVDYSEGRRNIINEYRNKVNNFRNLPGVESVQPELDKALLGEANLNSQYAKTSVEKTAAVLRAYELGCDLAIKVAEDGVATKSDPELWSRAKSEAKSRMGGKHSARAMQLAVKIYKERGGDYSGKKPSASQNKMRKWTKQDWQTRPGTDPVAKKEDGSTSRYLPKAKWDSLSKSEQKATDAKKRRSDEQYVENTDAAKVKGNAKYIKSSEFVPDYTPEDLKSMGVYDQVYGDAPSEASMDKWPAHWLHEQDPLGWLQWYERYSGGRRTEDDARQIKRWESFKARHGSQYASKPTDRRKAALRNWGINADKLVKTSEDVYLTHAVSPDSIESIRKRGLLSAKAITSDDELLNLARADFSPEKREAWKAKVLERLKSDPEAVSGSSVFFNSPDYSKLTPDHNINSRHLKNIRVNISKLLADRPNTRIRGVELVPHNKGKYSDRVRDLSISDVTNYTSKTPEELWKDYDPKPGYYAPDVPHAFVLTDDGIIPPEYLDIK
jgi:adenylate kinase family enzyme